MKKAIKEAVAALILVAVGIGFGWGGTYLVGHQHGLDEAKAIWHKELVKRGYAEYNSKTGDWEWKK